MLKCPDEVNKFYDSGYQHEGRVDNNPYAHDRRADRNSF